MKTGPKDTSEIDLLKAEKRLQAGNGFWEFVLPLVPAGILRSFFLPLPVKLPSFLFGALTLSWLAENYMALNTSIFASATLLFASNLAVALSVGLIKLVVLKLGWEKDVDRTVQSLQDYEFPVDLHEEVMRLNHRPSANTMYNALLDTMEDRRWKKKATRRGFKDCRGRSCDNGL